MDLVPIDQVVDLARLELNHLEKSLELGNFRHVSCDQLAINCHFHRCALKLFLNRVRSVVGSVVLLPFTAEQAEKWRDVRFLDDLGRQPLGDCLVKLQVSKGFLNC